MGAHNYLLHFEASPYPENHSFQILLLSTMAMYSRSDASYMAAVNPSPIATSFTVSDEHQIRVVYLHPDILSALESLDNIGLKDV